MASTLSAVVRAGSRATLSGNRSAAQWMTICGWNFVKVWRTEDSSRRSSLSRPSPFWTRDMPVPRHLYWYVFLLLVLVVMELLLISVKCFRMDRPSIPLAPVISIFTSMLVGVVAK